MKPQTKRRQITEVIGQHIVDGRWSTGCPIAPDAIAEEFGLSRSIMREAICVLEGKGMITARPGTGTVVLPASHWSLLDPDVARWIAVSPSQPELSVPAKEFTDALHTLAEALPGNLYVEQALAALEHRAA